LNSSRTAAIAVLKAKRWSMSLVTLSIAQCALRTMRSASAFSWSASGTGASGSSSAASAETRHSRDKNRNMPSTPLSDQSAPWSGGPMNKM
jgi:hypothetical protein